MKKVFLKIAQQSQEKHQFWSLFFNKAAVLQASRYFLVNIEKFLRTNFLKEHLRTAASEGSFYVKKRNHHFFHIKIQIE